MHNWLNCLFDLHCTNWARGLPFLATVFAWNNRTDRILFIYIYFTLVFKMSLFSWHSHVWPKTKLWCVLASSLCQKINQISGFNQPIGIFHLDILCTDGGGGERRFTSFASSVWKHLHLYWLSTYLIFLLQPVSLSLSVHPQYELQ